MRFVRGLPGSFLSLGLTLGLAACGGGGGAMDSGGDTDTDTDTGGGTDGTATAGVTEFVNGACLVDADCGPGFGCVLAVCAAGCESDADCATGLVCDPHGGCTPEDDGMGEDPFDPSGSFRVEPAEQEWEVGATEASFTIFNDGDDELRYRLVGNHPALTFDTAPATIPAGEAMDIMVDVDVASIDQAIDRRLEVEVVTDVETIVWVLEIPPTPTGNYIGHLVFNDEKLLGQYKVDVDLAFDPDGTVTGWVEPSKSLMWPNAVLVTGTWDATTGEVELRVPDTIPESFAGAGDIPAEEGPFGRLIGRDVRLSGSFSPDGTFIEGDLLETLTGLLPTPVELPGSFRLTHQGVLVDPNGADSAGDFSQALPVSLPEWEFPMDLDAGECTGLGTDYGTAGTLPTNGPDFLTACTACADADCTPPEKKLCAEGLVQAGYNVPSVVNEAPGQVELPTAAQWAWTDCTDQTSDHYIPGENITCLDPAALSCAGALLRQAAVTLTDTDTLTNLLDQIHKEGTGSALIGTENLIQAAFAYRSIAQSNVAQKELELVRDQTRRLLGRMSRITNAPGFGNLLAALGKPILFGSPLDPNARQGRDISQALTLTGEAIKALALQLRLTQALELTDANREPMRQLVNHTAAWTHVQAAMWKDVLEFYEMEDTFNELSVFGEATNTLTSVHQELEPGTNQFGYSPEWVPLKLTASQAEKGISNFEVVWEDANFLVEDFIERLDQAAMALDEYDEQAFTVTEKAAEIESNYDERIGDLCGYSDGQPDLGGCGVDGAGEIGILALQVGAAKIRMEEARVSLTNNYQRIQLEEDRIRQIIFNHAQLEQFIDMAQAEIFAVGDQAGAMKNAARMANATKQCGIEMGKAGAEAAVIVAETAADVAENLGKMCTPPLPAPPVPAPCPNIGGAAAAAAVGAVKTAAEFTKAGLECASVKNSAGLENTLDDVNSWEGTQVLIINNQIDEAMRNAGLEDQVINSKALVKNLTLDNLTLDLELQAARKDVEVAVAELQKAVGEVSALLTRKARAVALVTTENPLNPMANPRFLQARLELGKDVLRRRVRTLRETYKAGRALEYHINRDFPQIETMLVPARSSTELTDFMTCSMGVFNDFKTQPATSDFVKEVSLRDDIFGLSDRVRDEVLDLDVSPEEQFRAILSNPEHVQADGSVELRITLPLVGDTVFSSAICDDRLVTIEVLVQGDNLGDDETLVLVEREGKSQIRRCDSKDLPADKALVDYTLGFRSAPVQAHVGQWDNGGQPSGAFTDWPSAGEQWVIRIPVSPSEGPQNQDLNLNNIEDIVLRLNRLARPLSGQFIPDCG